LYLLFATYCILALTFCVLILIRKWRNSQGLARVQFQYFGVGAIISVTGGSLTNVFIPLSTGTATYGWIGPYFLFPFVVLVAHAIIRHRLMDLRLVVHRGLTMALATTMSLLPVCLLLLTFWSQVSTRLASSELLVVLASIVLATLLASPTRDLAGLLIDRYLYRTEANFRTTVRDTSRRLAQCLDLSTVVDLIGNTVSRSAEYEGVALYLYSQTGFRRQMAERHRASAFSVPEHIPAPIEELVLDTKDPLTIDELLRAKDELQKRATADLLKLRWALVLPLVFENSVIGVVALGAKRSGDPFYPHDLDLLLTLVNQAGVAIKNAQLYTQVVVANEHIENIVATLESGVVAVDAEGFLTVFNRAAQDLTGLSVPQLRGQTINALPEALARPIRVALTTGEGSTEPEIPLPCGNNARPILCTTSALLGPAGAVLGAVAVFNDLTPIKQLESERRRAERLAYFETLASSLAHEIKNPLVAIKTFSQLIPRRLNDARFVEEFSRIITREIGRVERLVGRLTTLSYPSERPKHAINVHLPLNDATEFLKPAFDEKSIRLVSVERAQPVMILGDRGELEQLFLNLLMNAHEATPPQGTVTITVQDSTGHVTVSIADSGAGIPDELIDRIFDPLITTKPRGSGLGLTISAGIASSHRAKVRAMNGPEGGAVFTVEFPIAVAPGARVDEDSPARHAG
jgi:PAS domain S-box-containing protein